MKRITLQPRLRLLAEMTPHGGRLADIGTDHGYLPVWLLQEGRIPSAIAADVGAEPLEHARRTAEEYETQGLDFRLCDGLSGIEAEETDTVVIAGMGGETIRDILRAAPWAADGHHTLLLQPMTKVELLRGWLRENGYSCTEERLVQDKGKLYDPVRHRWPLR
ncbi:MAG: class I SAM-dependent methyltransferase [Oscillospiraceae bacterium]